MEPRTLETILEAQKEAIRLKKQWTGTAQDVHRLLDSVTYGCQVERLRLEEISLLSPNFGLATVTASHFADCTLIRGVFRDATILDSQMERCIFDRSAFFGANLRNCGLSASDFSRCQLTSAQFYQCDLSGAKFWGACLDATSFTQCDLRGVEGLWHCGPGGSRGDMVYAVGGQENADGFLLKTGCFWGTLDEFKDMVEQGRSDKFGRAYYTEVLFPALEGIKRINALQYKSGG